MPSTRKQKAKEKRSRQSNVLSDIENHDAMLGSYQRDSCEIQGEKSENEINLRSKRQDQELNHNY